MYGTAEIKKVDTKSIPFDFSLFNQMCTNEFTEIFETEFDSFLNALHAEQAEGTSLLFYK
jgi:hypothetical protein